MPAGILGQPRSALLIPGAPPEPITVSDTGCSVTPAPLTLTATSQRTVIGVAAIAPATLVLSAASQGTVNGVATVTAAAVTITATSQRTIIGVASLSAASLILAATSKRSVIGSGVLGLPPGLIVPGVPPQAAVMAVHQTTLLLGDLVVTAASQRSTSASAAAITLAPLSLTASGATVNPVLIAADALLLTTVGQRTVLGVAFIGIPESSLGTIGVVTFHRVRRAGYASAAAGL